MKKILFAILASLPVFVSASQYVSVHFGTDYGLKTDESNAGQKVGYNIGLVYGRELQGKVRTELEVSYREDRKRTVYTEVEKYDEASKKFQSKHTWSYMKNVLYDINQLQCFLLCLI